RTSPSRHVPRVPGAPWATSYYYAAESILAARRLAGLDTRTMPTSPNTEARAQAATDIYHALPESERAAVSTEMARKLGPLWFGNPTTPDEDAASQPVHAATL